MGGYYSNRRNGQQGVATSAAPAPLHGNVRDILAEDEEPSSFESFFRFLGRPGFMVRTALSGDVSGFLKNTAQLAQEVAFFPGIVNHSLLPFGDLTKAEDRPEASDLLHRWGMLPDRGALGSVEKFGIDLVGGILTDPLSLVGGGTAKTGTSAAKLSGLGRSAARQELVGALRRGSEGTGKKLHEQFLTNMNERVAEVVGKTSRAPRFEPLANVKSLDDLHALVPTLPSAGPGLNQSTVAKIIREVEGSAAEKTFFQVRQKAIAEGMPLRTPPGKVPALPVEEGFASWLSGEATTVEQELSTLLGRQSKAAVVSQPSMLDSLTNSLGQLGSTGHLTNSMLAQKNLKSLDLTLGQPMKVLFRPENEVSVTAAVKKINDAVANLTPTSGRRMRDGLRDLGYSDDWTVPFLKRQFGHMELPTPAGGKTPLINLDAGTLDDYMKLGHELPLSVADEGIEALVKAGMAPGGGLSINPLWSDDLGRAAERIPGWHYRNGFVYVPWESVGSATAPGIVRGIANRMGWQGVNQAEDLFMGAFTTAQRKLLDRFNFGYSKDVNKKAAVAVTELARQGDNEFRGGMLQGMRRALENFSDVLPPQVYQAMTMATLKAEDVFHSATRAWRDDGPRHVDEIVARIDQAIPRTPEGAASIVGNDPDGLVKLVNSLDTEIRDAPWNATMSKEALKNLMATGATSKVRKLQEAGQAAGKLVSRWEALDAPVTKLAESTRGAYRIMESNLDDMSKIAALNDTAPLKAQMVAYKRSLELRKETTAALGKIRRLAGATPGGDMTRIKGINKALRARQKELAEESKRLLSDLKQVTGKDDMKGWVDTLEEADDVVRHAEWEARANQRIYDQFHDELRTAFTRRNSDLGKAVQASARTLLAGRLTQQVIDEVSAGLPPELRTHVEKAINFGQEEMRKIPPFMRYHAKNADALLRGDPAPGPAWQTIDEANPFYMPHQASPKLLDALLSPHTTPADKVRLSSEFDRARELPTAKAFLEHMAEVADSMGIEGASDELLQTDFRALTLQRMAAFEKTKAMQRLYQSVIKIAGKEGGAWETYTKFLDGVLHPTGPRKNTFLKFLSGGSFDIPIKRADPASASKWVRNLNRSFDTPEGDAAHSFARIVEIGGESHLRIKWPGLNGLYKPFLTSIPTNLRFRVRNVLSAPIQASFHPEIRFAGVEPIMKTLRNDGLVRWAIGHFSKTDGWAGASLKETSDTLKAMKPEQRISWATSTLVRATTAVSAAERMAAREALGRLSDTVGPYSWPEVLDVLDLVADPRKSVGVDLKAGINEMTDLFSVLNKPTHEDPNALGKIVRGLGKFVDFGMQISNEQEAAMRTMTALNLLKLGKSPTEVVMEVNRLQVDYSIQSEVEQWARGIIPFVRYMIGSSAWAADMLSNPSGAGKGLMGKLTSVQGLGLAQRSLTGTGESETSLLPRHAKETLAMPLPWKDMEGNREFLTSLGFPQETVINMLALAGGRRESVMHTVAGGIQPAVKLPLEYMTNRNFHFGSEWGAYRKSPAALIPFSQDIPGPNDTVRHEVPGAVNELINASPLSGVESTVNRLADPRQPIALRLLNAATGLRVQSVDEEAELQKRIAEFLKGRVRSGEVGELEVFFNRLREEDVPDEVKAVLSELERIRADRRRNKEKKK